MHFFLKLGKKRILSEMKFSFKSEIADDQILKRGFSGSRQRIIAVDPISPEVLFDFGQKIKTAAISRAKIEKRVQFRKMCTAV